MKLSKLLTVALLASSAALVAQDDGSWYRLYLGAGFNFADGHTLKMTGQNFGGVNSFTVEGGMEFKHPMAQRVTIRPNIGISKIIGADPDYPDPTDAVPNPAPLNTRYDLIGSYLGVDLVFQPFKSLPITLSTGPYLYSWQVNKRATLDARNQGETDMSKLGWRLGGGYVINKTFRAELTYSITEWRTINSSRSTTFVPGFNPSRPTYITLKGYYRF
jgi:hypothetical protein